MEDVEIQHLDEPVKVYNFTVEDNHTYYVGDSGVWVHNAACSGNASNKVLGGRYKDVKATQAADEVGHHFPQNAFNRNNGLAIDDGPALLMKKVDHALTRTYRGRGKATMIKDAGLNARQRMVLDIIDIRKNFGTKYNKGMLEAIRYAKTLSQFVK